ncbi:DUF2232 domain-containing protein [Hazenella coriacea]|uniref:Uncharacterized protein YybS (DUF2232 family) n=1 Tax=Hazenella coriacea TaxID=1179467 RepID=A0A4R3LB33_9BACL|nr:DUF2232 domain-containing protein [Hazenella coriacea]TCS95504.1 uncharacterized protein YybS (DUF2232 family) [Hazenella coriacea]
MSHNTKGVVKDSLITFGLFLLLLASLIIPGVNLISLWLLPLPFFYLKAKQSWGITLFYTLGMGLMFFIFPLTPFQFIYFHIVAVGLVMGELYRRENTTGTDIVLGGMITGLVGSWILLLISEYVFHLMAQLREAWSSAWETAKGIVNTPTDLPVPSLEMIIPNLLFFLIVPTALLTFLVGMKWMTRIGYPKKSLPLFRDWRLPRVFFYFYFLTIIVTFLVGEEADSSLQSLLLGITGVFQFLFIIQGISFIAFLLHHKSKSKAWITLPILLTFSPLNIIILFMGILDSGLRLRERMFMNKS